MKRFGYQAIYRTPGQHVFVSEGLYDDENSAREDLKECFVALGPKIEWEEEDSE